MLRLVLITTIIIIFSLLGGNIYVINPKVGSPIHLKIEVKNYDNKPITYNKFIIRIIDSHGNPIYSECFYVGSITLQPKQTHTHTITLNYNLRPEKFGIVVEVYNNNEFVNAFSKFFDFRPKVSVVNMNVVGYTIMATTGFILGFVLSRLKLLGGK